MDQRGKKSWTKIPESHGFHEGGVSYQFSEIASAFDLYEQVTYPDVLNELSV